MNPGEEFKFQVQQSAGGRQTPQGYIEDPPANQFVIGTIVFSDDTYEGEAEAALKMIAVDRGRRLQVTRMMPLLQNLIDTPQADVPKALDELETQIKGLRIDPDEVLLERLKAQFPEVFKQSSQEVLGRVIQGMRQARDVMANNLSSVRRAWQQQSNSFDLATVLTRIKKHSEERWLPRRN